MNKKIELSRNTIILFIINISILILTIVFKTVYNMLEYNCILVNLFLILNILLLIIGIIYNYLILKNKKKYDNRKYIVISICLFIIFILLNTLAVYIINKQIQTKYVKTSDKLNSYCDSYQCSKFSTVYKSNAYIYKLEKKYIDYNNTTNNIIIYNKYNEKGIYEVSAHIISDKNLYSSYIIKEQLQEWFSHFNYDINIDKISKAFNKRFKSNVKDGAVSYKVNEKYIKKQLYNIETVITLKIKQD